MSGECLVGRYDGKECTMQSKQRSLTLMGALLVVCCTNCGYRYYPAVATTRLEQQLALVDRTTPVSGGTPSTPQERCLRRLASLAREHDRFRDAQEPLLYAGVAVAVGTGVVAGISSSTRPGENATTVPDALRSEGDISGVEVANITFAAVSAVATGLGTVFATQAGNRQSQLQKIEDLLAQPNGPTESDASRYCH